MSWTTIDKTALRLMLEKTIEIQAKLMDLRARQMLLRAIQQMKMLRAQAAPTPSPKRIGT